MSTTNFIKSSASGNVIFVPGIGSISEMSEKENHQLTTRIRQRIPFWARNWAAFALGLFFPPFAAFFSVNTFPVFGAALLLLFAFCDSVVVVSVVVVSVVVGAGDADASCFLACCSARSFCMTVGMWVSWKWRWHHSKNIFTEHMRSFENIRLSSSFSHFVCCITPPTAMDLLPKDLSQFHTKEYWNSFFQKRGKEAFEWYGEYRDVRSEFQKLIPKDAKILIIGCGNSEMSAEMYDDGKFLTARSCHTVTTSQLLPLTHARRHCTYTQHLQRLSCRLPRYHKCGL